MCCTINNDLLTAYVVLRSIQNQSLDHKIVGESGLLTATIKLKCPQTQTSEHIVQWLEK